MAKARLNMSAEERRKHNNAMHRKQEKARREKAEREACRIWVKEIVDTFERLGWSKTELVVGADDEMIDAVVDEIMSSGKFKMVLGKQKIGVKKCKG